MSLDRPGIAAAVLSFAVLAVPPVTGPAAHASPLAAGGGLEYAHGVGDEITRTGHAFVAGRLPWATVTMAGARYDHGAIGAGGAGIAGLALPLGSTSSWQAWAARFVGDASFRAWRLKSGPQWTAPDGRSLGLFFVHWSDNLGGRTNGAAAELAFPLRPRLQGRVNGGVAAHGNGEAQGAVGLAWTPRRHVEIAGDIGLANGAVTATGFAPAKPGRGLPPVLPILGDPDVGNEPASAPGRPATDLTFTLGVRVALP